MERKSLLGRVSAPSALLGARVRSPAILLLVWVCLDGRCKTKPPPRFWPWRGRRLHVRERFGRLFRCSEEGRRSVRAQRSDPIPQHQAGRLIVWSPLTRTKATKHRGFALRAYETFRAFACYTQLPAWAVRAVLSELLIFCFLQAQLEATDKDVQCSRLESARGRPGKRGRKPALQLSFFGILLRPFSSYSRFTFS